MLKKELDWLALPEGYEFGTIETDEEMDELVEFNSKMHEPSAGMFLKRIVNYLPGFTRDMNYVIRDTSTGRIVACINGIPGTWAYEDVHLKTLELGFVGTLESHRNKGLINSLYSYFDKRLRDEQYDLSIIQGIPYFYRKFGYDFIIPLFRNISLPVVNIPASKIEDNPSLAEISIRPAKEQDIPAMMDLLQQENRRLLLSSVRDEQLWRVQERLKMNIFILDRQLRSDGIKVSIFRQERDKSGQWIDQSVDPQTIKDLENTILARARHFRTKTPKL